MTLPPRHLLRWSYVRHRISRSNGIRAPRGIPAKEVVEVRVEATNLVPKASWRGRGDFRSIRLPSEGPKGSELGCKSVELRRRTSVVSRVLHSEIAQL